MKTIQITGKDALSLAVELLKDKEYIVLNEQDFDLKYISTYSNIVIIGLTNVGVYNLIKNHVKDTLIVITSEEVEIETNLTFKLK